MKKHTPGPWVIDWNVSRLDIFSSDAATHVATLRRSSLSSALDDTAKANARLIAAAPDLYAFAKLCARLNPDAGEIGPGMLAQLVAEARRIVGED